MGRWSAAHWKTATFGWLALVLVAFGVGGMVGTKNVDPNAPGPGESGRMDRILDAGFKQPAGESVLIQSRSLAGGRRPPSRRAIGDVVARRLEARRRPERQSPLGPQAVDATRHSALVEFEIRGDSDKAVDKIEPVLDGVAAAQRAHPRLLHRRVRRRERGEGGRRRRSANDLAKAGLLSLPITLIILVVAFGALVAAGIPLLLALTAVFATFGLVALPSHLLPMAIAGARRSCS